MTETPTKTEQPRFDPFGAFAYALYIAVGGLLIFGFAWALRSAVDVQNESACRGLNPDDREGPAPAFTVENLNGEPVSLEDFRGKLVILNFWATWCPPCIAEWPQLHRLAERLRDRDDVVVVALSVDEDRTAIEPFLQRMSLQDTNVVVLWDPKQEVHKQFGTNELPDVYFIDERGELSDAFINSATRKWGSPEAYHCTLSRVGRAE